MSLKLKITALLVILCSLTSWATHIVGGEFELIYISGFRYKLRLIQYFDVIYGNPGAEDNAIVVSIFRNRDNKLMSTVLLDKVERTLVEYTSPECAIGQLVTRKLVYENEITLNPSSVVDGVNQDDGYDDPEGYHVVMERCCRNNVIDNAYQPAPNTVGQTWTLDFPPVMKDGERFINSSPVLFPPLSDYACVGQLYYFDFAGVDLDGDSVVYSLVTPFNSSSIIALPTAQPKPHEPIIWSPGIDIDHVIPGDPPLNTTINGFLTVNPSRAGLYVFALLAEEFRDGEKIGEVRRDFQMLVIDCPGPNFPPKIRAIKKGETEFFDEQNIMHFAYNEEKCFEFVVTDLNSQDFENTEHLTFEVNPINFEADISQILPTDTGSLNNEIDTLKFEVCFPDCPYLDDEPFLIEFKAKDQTCPLPLEDTLQLAVQIDLPPNQDPFFADEFSSPLLSLQVTDTLKEGDIFEITIFGIDADGDSMELFIEPDGFNLDDFGMIISDSISTGGKLITKFSWDTGCGVNNYGLFSDFSINLTLDDIDQCLVANADTLHIDLHVFLPTNNDPVVTTSLPILPDSNNVICLPVEVIDSVDFTVFADDIDQDYIFLKAYPGGEFQFDDYGMKFQDVEGLQAISSQFTWNPNCGLIDPDGDNIFPVYFVATDIDTCKIPNADTLTVQFELQPPYNQIPELTFVDLPSPDLLVRPETSIDVDLTGVDFDNDNISLELFSFNDKVPRSTFTFEEVSGTGSVNSSFHWIPPCDLISENSSNIFDFVFLLFDDYCVRPNGDTLILSVTLDDSSPEYNNFIPPNVFTPNGDQINDEFYIDDLPVNTCDVKFVAVKIFNRWGTLVFQDNKREFKWDGKGMPAGVYYYYIEYSNHVQYKGTVSILF